MLVPVGPVNVHVPMQSGNSVCACMDGLLCLPNKERISPLVLMLRGCWQSRVLPVAVCSPICQYLVSVCFSGGTYSSVKQVKSTNGKAAKKSIGLNYIARPQAVPGVGSCGQARLPDFRAAEGSGHLLHPFRCLNVIWVHQA